MSIDKQRLRGVDLLEGLGYRWDGVQWQAPALPAGDLTPEADRMHSVLMGRHEALAGCIEDSEEAAELERVSAALEAYELRRWPAGKIQGGKG